MNHLLHFTSRERSGILLLLLLNGLLWLAPELWKRLPLYREPDPAPRWAALEAEQKAGLPPPLPAVLFPFDPNEADTVDLHRLGLSPRVVRNIARFREKGGRFRRPQDFRRIYGLSAADYERLVPYLQLPDGKKQFVEKEEKAKTAPLELLPFDPLTVTGAALHKMGLSPMAVKAFLNYREKGGRIRSAQDLGRIYGISPNDVQRLAPLMQIPAEESKPQMAETARAEKNKFFSNIDINQADTTAWQSLPGIGPVLSIRIVKYRERLGGFTTVDQVAETYGLPDSVFQKIQPYLHLSPVLRSLFINQIDEETLRKHPYLNWRQARAIIAYRREHGSFTSADDLCKVQALPKGLCEKLAAYCRWDP